MGVTIGALQIGESEFIRAYIAEMGGREDATAVGIPQRVPARSAAYSNAWLAELLDYEDTQKFGGNHPGATIVPAALAVASIAQASGARILAGVVGGYEVANRLARAVYPDQTQRGFLSTGTAGTFGAAAAAAYVLNLPVEQIEQALKICGFLLPISAADTLWEGESIKPGHAAQAAATGVEAALFASRGITGGPLEGGRRGLGYLNMVTDKVDQQALLGGLGEEFTLGDCAIKPYPTCGYTHGPIDAAIKLHHQLSVPASQIDSVVVRAYDFCVQAVGERYTTLESSFTACQFSIPFAVAAALIDGEVGLAQFRRERRAERDIHDLARRIQVVEDPAMTARYPASFPCQVEVSIGGETSIAAVDSPRGTPQQPLAAAEIRAKFFSLVEPVLGALVTAQLEETIMHLNDQSIFDWPLVDLAGAVGATEKASLSA